jgi:hypothetical protein
LHLGRGNCAVRRPAFAERSGVLAEHEHWFTTFTFELFEQHEGFLFQTQAAFLVAVDNVKGVLAPVVLNVVSLESYRQDFVTGVFDAYAERLENLNLWIVLLTRGAWEWSTVWRIFLRRYWSDRLSTTRRGYCRWRM